MPHQVKKNWPVLAGDCVSTRFCAGDSDVVFQSSDYVLFLLHKINLKICARGFTETCSEVVVLTETSTTLELLFQFCYPERHPDLESVEFGVLASLAEAAEKYEVFAAINICKIRMRRSLPLHPEQILTYATKHNYPEIMEEAASWMIAKPLSEILTKLPTQLVIPWVLYCERYDIVARRALSYSSRTGITFNQDRCNICGNKSDIERITLAIVENSRSLVKINTLFTPTKNCKACTSSPLDLAIWRTSIVNDLKNIPKFASFL